MKICALLIIFVQILLCISCDSGRNEVILSRSESLLETDPDSALSVLSSILYPEELSEKAYNRYALLKIQAEYKSYQDITSDSTILSVRDYYLEKKDYHNTALSSYYCGCYYKECGNKENAMRYFLEANEYADKGDDFNLKGLIRNAIGVILLNQFDIERAVMNFKESASFYKQAGNLKNELITYVQTGDCFQYSEQPDSALFYYVKCLHLADKENLSQEQSLVRQNLGILYAQKGELAKAIQYLNEALEYTSDYDNQIKIYLSLLEFYSTNNQDDLANVYRERLLLKKDSIKDIYVKANLLQVLSEKEEQLKNYPEALAYHKMYAENLLQVIDINLDKRLLELDKKYNYEKIRSHNIRLKLEKANILIGIVIGTLLFIISILLLFRRYMKRKNDILELEAKIAQLNILAQKYNEKEKTFASYLLKHFDVLKKMTSLKIYMKKDTSHKDEFWIKKINEIIYGQDTLDWNVLYDVMNKLHNGFFNRLKELYPQLKEVEYRILCLTYSGFSTEEISIVLNLSIHTINTKRSAIRKSLGVAAFTNLRDFLNEKLS